MATLIILTAMAVGIFLAEILPRIAYVDEDWRHLRLSDNYNPSASRGRLFPMCD